MEQGEPGLQKAWPSPFSALRPAWKATHSPVQQVKSLRGDLSGNVKLEACALGDNFVYVPKTRLFSRSLNAFLPVSACRVFSQTLSHAIYVS